MSRWFRHYAGMMRDDKLVRVALRSKQSIERVCWVWGAILESAAEIDDDGRYDVDPAEMSYFLRADESDVDVIFAALTQACRVADGCVVKWGNRQFSSDRSKERVAAHRQRKRKEGSDGESAAGNGDVTLQAGHGNAPETETETELETDSVADATGADAPQGPSAIDLKKMVFDSGVPLLTSTGSTERNARSMIGRWVASHGEGAVLSVLALAAANPPVDPIPWIRTRLESRNGKRPANDEPQNPILRGYLANQRERDEGADRADGDEGQLRISGGSAF